MLRRLVNIIAVTSLLSCQYSISQEEIKGLWALDEVWIDGVLERKPNTFIKFDSLGQFAVARESGDIRGLYSLNKATIHFDSPDNQWFGSSWKSLLQGNRLELIGRGTYHHIQRANGPEPMVLNTKLVFSRAKSVPDFQEFEDALTGKWQLYKIRRDGKPQELRNTTLELSPSRFQISNDSNLLESGHVKINTRYRKLYFEGYETAWNAWFYGNELRLTNDYLNLEYSLRR